MEPTSKVSQKCQPVPEEDPGSPAWVVTDLRFATQIGFRFFVSFLEDELDYVGELLRLQ